MSKTQREFEQSLPLYGALFDILQEFPEDLIPIIIEYVYRVETEEHNGKRWIAEDLLLAKYTIDGPLFDSRHLLVDDGRGGVVQVYLTRSQREMVSGKFWAGPSGTVLATIEAEGNPTEFRNAFIYPKGVKLLDQNQRVIFIGESLVPQSGLIIEYFEPGTGKEIKAIDECCKLIDKKPMLVSERYHPGSGKLSRRTITLNGGARVQLTEESVTFVDAGKRDESIWITLDEDGEPCTYRVVYKNLCYGLAYPCNGHNGRERWKCIQVLTPLSNSPFYICDQNEDDWSIHSGVASSGDFIVDPDSIDSKNGHAFPNDVTSQFITSSKQREYWMGLLETCELDRIPHPYLQMCLDEVKKFKAAQNDPKLTLKARLC
jgi:hypothetical protein